MRALSISSATPEQKIWCLGFFQQFMNIKHVWVMQKHSIYYHCNQSGRAIWHRPTTHDQSRDIHPIRQMTPENEKMHSWIRPKESKTGVLKGSESSYFELRPLLHWVFAWIEWIPRIILPCLVEFPSLDNLEPGITGLTFYLHYHRGIWQGSTP